ncbi:4Fe-4S binding protein, partial [Streptomyces sp. NPDC059766]|uniref:4Fe-4S binding protein n=1 Tax=Streptomyces sp. NPDC059766 TaxID=3346940 RepID=UPI003658A91D
MTHVIAQSCCNDAACVPVCPVNCIHPTPDEPDYATAEMLYIDPAGCIDCGACIEVCPVGAIHPDYDLPADQALFGGWNAAFYQDRPADDPKPAPKAPRTVPATAEPLGVAIVGSGPSGFYAAAELLGMRGLDVRVDMFERLPVPGGLVRYGIAPDHQQTKGVFGSFSRTMINRKFRLFANTEVGRDISHAELAERYHAVIYAVGAPDDRRLSIPGEELPGSHSAAEFVAWYNGHPDHRDHAFDLDTERAVIIGNGNVALDVARILLGDAERLRSTDIADHALDALRRSRIKEVVLIGRRGPQDAAFSSAELLGLRHLSDVDVRIATPECRPSLEYAGADLAPMTRAKLALLDELDARTGKQPKAARLAFLRSPVEVLG